MNILLIDDDQELLELLRDYLVKDGFVVRCAQSGEAGIQALLREAAELVVLDVMMPSGSGIQVLEKIRTFSNVPILMLTAKGDDEDRILGLELGADDYVPKPCTPRELAARIRAILKRVMNQTSNQPVDKADQSNQIIVGSLVLWPGKRKVQSGGVELSITSTEFSLLEVLARYAGHPVSKERLSEEALGRPLSRYDRSIDVHISSIRQKIATLSNGHSPIQTVIRKGYQLIVE
jgi:two-component system, OmpR family, response regulator